MRTGAVNYPSDLRGTGCDYFQRDFVIGSCPYVYFHHAVSNVRRRQGIFHVQNTDGIFLLRAALRIPNFEKVIGDDISGQ